MLLTAELLLHYQRCDRRAFLNLYGDATQMEPPSDFKIKLHQDRLAHQQTVLTQQSYYRPSYPKGDRSAGASATLALMQQGVDRIYRGILLTQIALPFPLNLLSQPDLLIKQPGKSRFGDWLYVPVEIELGKRAKFEYQIVAAFHAQVLAQVQEAMPETAWLILREKGNFSVRLDIRIPQMQTILKECARMLFEKREPEVFISRQRCSICGWHSYCYGVAKSQQHLSLLPGVTPSRYTHLQALNLTTLESLANVSLSVLESVFDRQVSIQLIRQAQSVLENKIISISDRPLNLPDATVELYFDIEAEPDLDIAFLLGVMVVDRSANTEKLYAFLAEKPEDEASIWQQFLELVGSHPLAPIYHFCDYEILAVKQLGKRYNTPKYLWQTLPDRFIDIHEKICSTAILPIESYSLKSIARWLGFEWRDTKANGAQAIYWYNRWLKSGDRTFLDAIVRYNEDDCRATHHLKDWLAKL